MRPVKPFIGGDAVPTLIQILKICLKTLRSRRTMLDSANVHAHVDEPQSWKRPRCTVSITGSLRQFTSLSANHSISYTTASLRFDAHVPTDGAGGYFSVADVIGPGAPFGGLAALVEPPVFSVSRRRSLRPWSPLNRRNWLPLIPALTDAFILGNLQPWVKPMLPACRSRQ